MKPLSDDTSVEANAVHVALLRDKTPAQRLALALQLRASADTMALARLRVQYPDDDDRERRLRLAALHLDRDTMVAAFGWDPEVRGR